MLERRFGCLSGSNGDEPVADLACNVHAGLCYKNTSQQICIIATNVSYRFVVAQLVDLCWQTNIQPYNLYMRVPDKLCLQTCVAAAKFHDTRIDLYITQRARLLATLQKTSNDRVLASC